MSGEKRGGEDIRHTPADGARDEAPGRAAGDAQGAGAVVRAFPVRARAPETSSPGGGDLLFPVDLGETDRPQSVVDYLDQALPSDEAGGAREGGSARGAGAGRRLRLVK